MALIEELEESGSWLFRWRSYLPIIFVTAGFYMMLDYRYIGHSATWDRYWDLTCLGVSLLGLLIRCYTIGYTPKNTSGRNAKAQIADTLNTTGIYSLVRNPLYLGNYAMFLGVVLFFHSLPFTLIFTLTFFIYYERIIFAEECYLRRKFGDQYLEWTKLTPAIMLKGPRIPPTESAFLVQERAETGIQRLLCRGAYVHALRGFGGTASPWHMGPGVYSFLFSRRRLSDLGDAPNP